MGLVHRFARSSPLNDPRFHITGEVLSTPALRWRDISRFSGIAVTPIAGSICPRAAGSRHSQRPRQRLCCPPHFTGMISNAQGRPSGNPGLITEQQALAVFRPSPSGTLQPFGKWYSGSPNSRNCSIPEELAASIAFSGISRSTEIPVEWWSVFLALSTSWSVAQGQPASAYLNMVYLEFDISYPARHQHRGDPTIR